MGEVRITVRVNAPPVDGAANEAVSAALADALGVRRRLVSIATGHSSRTKLVVVTVPDEDVPGLRATIALLLD
jgi:uncharacterized protein YggU (UPF0235/DUF167 family)